MDKDKNRCPKGGKGIGGQAVIEGVMMRGKKIYALAVRNSSDKKINIEKKPVRVYSERCKIWGFPIIRGVVSFVDSLVLGMKIISRSAEMSGLSDVSAEEDEKPSRFEQFLDRKFGDNLGNYIIYFSVFLSIILSIAIFMVLPVWIGNLCNKVLHLEAYFLGVIEGFVRILIFLGYIILTAQLKDVKRVFMYHGAEHKTINCFEHNEELTVENVRKHTRLHKRCGTSFLFLVMIVSMLVFLFLNIDTVWIRIVSRILLVPLIAGISYEIIKWAGRNDNLLVKIVSAPGLALQLVTTKEPDDSMIEVAISALNGVLDEEPEEPIKSADSSK